MAQSDVVQWWQSVRRRVRSFFRSSPSRPASHLLIVEDNPSMATFLERLLEDEYTVHTAATGSAALRWLADHTPALIVLDLELPDMSGYDVLQTLQNTPSLAEIPVFVLSAHSRSMIPVRCFDLGAEEFLSKPFNPEELQVRLHKLNGAEESAGPP